MKKEYDIKKLKKAEPKYLKYLKEPVTIRLDSNVIKYFKNIAQEAGIPYQSLINYILKEYATLGLQPSANWPIKKNNTD